MGLVELFFIGTTLVLLAVQAVDALRRQESVHASTRQRMLDDAAKMWERDPKPALATTTQRATSARAIRVVPDLGCNPPRLRCELNSLNAAAKDMRRGHERQPHKRASSCATPTSDS
jgi:hypothetical protein